MAMRKNRAHLYTATWVNLTDICLVKEAKHRERTESVHVKFKNKKNHLWVIEVKIVTISGGRVLTKKGCKGAF